MNDVAKSGAGARSWISENGGVVAIVVAVVAVGAWIHQGNQQIIARMMSLETRMVGVETRLGGVEIRLEGLDARVGGLETRMRSLETRVRDLVGRVSRMEGVLGVVIPAASDAGEE